MSGEGDVEYVLTLVAHVGKTDRPARTDALETAARAVLAILADERSTGEGEWADAMRAWQDARIRKVVRRARGAEWRRASALPGITVTSAPAAGADPVAPDGVPAEPADRGGELVKPVVRDGEPADPLAPDGGPDEPADPGQGPDEPAGPPAAEVRVFPPVPLDEVPKDLAKLQVTGTDLEDGELPPVPPGVPVLWVNPGLEMSTGKTMAQVGHAAHLAWWALPDAARKAWIDDGFQLAVRTAGKERWRELLGAGLPVVQDAGFTEVEPGSRTVVADHPALH